MVSSASTDLRPVVREESTAIEMVGKARLVTRR